MTSDATKKFQEAGIKLAEQQAEKVKTPLEPSSLTNKIISAQKKTDAANQ